MLRTTATSCDLEPLAWHQNVKLDPSAHARLNAEVSSRGSLGERNEREKGSRPGRCAGHCKWRAAFLAQLAYLEISFKHLQIALQLGTQPLPNIIHRGLEAHREVGENAWACSPT